MAGRKKKAVEGEIVASESSPPRRKRVTKPKQTKGKKPTAHTRVLSQFVPKNISERAAAILLDKRQLWSNEESVAILLARATELMEDIDAARASDLRSRLEKAVLNCSKNMVGAVPIGILTTMLDESLDERSYWSEVYSILNGASKIRESEAKTRQTFDSIIGREEFEALGLEIRDLIFREVKDEDARLRIAVSIRNIVAGQSGEPD